MKPRSLTSSPGPLIDTFELKRTRSPPILLIAQRQQQGAHQGIWRQSEFEWYQIDHIVGLPCDRDIPGLDDGPDVRARIVTAQPPAYLGWPGQVRVVADEDRDADRS